LIKAVFEKLLTASINYINDIKRKTMAVINLAADQSLSSETWGPFRGSFPGPY
jgi:hypothetical protein